MSKKITSENYLDHAEQQAIEKGLYDIPIVDADCHYMDTPLHKLADFLDEPWRSRFKNALAPTNYIPKDLGDRTIAGRLKSYAHFFDNMPDHEDYSREVIPLIHSSRKMAIDYNIIFPTDLLSLGVTPDPDVEVAIAYGYAAWMTETITPYHDSLKTMLYLPFSNPEACVDIIKEFGHKKGVVGAMVTTARNIPLYENRYMPLYKILEEKGLPLGFHTSDFWLQQPTAQFNKFISAHALGFPLNNMTVLINILFNGIPERFPDLKFIFIEAGVSWIPFMMLRLDTEYMYRSAEAPLLTKKPSEYIKNFYFTTQPLEFIENTKFMKALFDLIDAENQLLYASDYPHQDFDTPSSIYDIPFLSERAKRKILGENALKLFGIDQPVLWAKQGLGHRV